MAAAGKPEFEVATRDQKDKSALLKKQHNLRFLPRQGKPDKKTEHCIICLDDVDSDLMFYVERCGHRFCINCVKQHINVKLVDGKIPNCPHHGCVFHLSIDRCGDVLTFRERLVWMQRIKENSLPLAERVYCPYESCSHLMSKTELSRSGSYSGFRRCFKCRGGFCVHCRVPWHGKLSCNDYRRLYPNKFREDGVDAKLKSLASLCGWRQCPKCYHMVGRSYGCNRITCRCGNAFCYKCGYLWNRGIHGDCNQDEVISDFIFCQFLFLL
ncbi:potential E3 ubiquitin-protein ligase ariadne-1-like [Brassica rapa]|uniref:RBR-type E3 ubiquitin transferase n=1 Tax=Brassica campestris TaxID=3711 RepID=M4DVB1_BRACM|nr:potential E3 ubiquitin-protein ligase ariadne-1-like [Brassica rapa]